MKRRNEQTSGHLAKKGVAKTYSILISDAYDASLDSNLICQSRVKAPQGPRLAMSNVSMRSRRCGESMKWAHLSWMINEVTVTSVDARPNSG